MSSVGRYDQKGLKWTGQSDRLLATYTTLDKAPYFFGNAPNGFALSFNIGLRNADDNVYPHTFAYPQGSVGWSFKSGSNPENAIYEFDLSAGGKLWSEGEHKYTITVVVDDKHTCAVTTNPKSDLWVDTVKKCDMALAPDSNIKVTFADAGEK
ncbi:hypothetical protein [Parendozoicomonas sp. Alg238-R29]|uniref:hypothetical protein n=1 Tax=Parendozoicomonas sp. Alg238-R29 TaxID=2993446 RepID=UPI00248E4DDD|nr:hypothetical protein [Parendozoicomonas sp. Alg238-R29]